MQTSDTLAIANPFALMLNPAEVFQAIGRSDRLERLQRRVCRPLDKPLIAHVPADFSDYDHAIDAEPETDE
ncbi:hypothetical protein [Rhizobacter sp. Root1221]|uniref:hypothetical protein n=1 Tax=Rhizobacter sp. Root1221 TaxID=1736433 RepID=UPI0006F4FDC0|nr:hypothetical protein [Rhizobacter sp. Root1221]KQV99414.1 hypothetical protein ASC87_20265 [Rhizobacter sp. Root1221]